MKLGMRVGLFLAVISQCVFSPNAAAALGGPPVYLLPMECSELLPDTDPFVRYLDSVARGNLTTEAALSRKIFRILALREKVNETLRKATARNPVDIYVQKTLCFYRQQKEPLKPVPYDDAEFLTFLKSSFDDLEKEIYSALQQTEVEQIQKKEFERRLEQNRDREESLRLQAQQEADKQLKAITEAARRQVKRGS
jgi:hypothetical protein